MPQTDLADRLLARDRAAVAEALNLIDDQRPEQREAAEGLQERLEGKGTAALRVGLTGAPGAGKSTLIDALVRTFRARDQTVGIIAVDPSSSRSGGALLGDRVRVRSRSSDPGVFIRSMATRLRLGGLADSTRAGVDILIATPGRLLDLMGQGLASVTGTEILILDEADRMLDMGFLPDLRRILAQVPRQRQTLLFSATMPPPIRKLAGDILHDPVPVQVARD